MASPHFKRTVLSSAITLACSGGSAWAACPGTVSGTQGPCTFSGVNSLTVTGTGKINAMDAGQTSATATAVFISSELTGTLDNSGSISARARAFDAPLTTSWSSDFEGAAQARAISIDGNLANTLSNSGVISAKGTGEKANASATAIRINGDIQGALSNTGTIKGTVSGSGLATVISSSWATGIGDLNAYGLYSSGGLDSTLTNTGTIAAEATGDGNNLEAYGLYIDGDVDGTITNTGTISGRSTVNGVTTTGTTWSGSGTFTVGSATAGGATIGGDLNGTLTNTGTISGEVIARNGAEADSVYGLKIQGYLYGDIDNRGTISARAEALRNWGGSAYAVVIEDSVYGSLDNAGIISAAVDGGTGGSAYGIYIGGYIYAGGSLDNSGKITASVDASGTSATAMGVYLDYGIEGELRNSGMISANADVAGTYIPTSTWSSGVSAEAYGIYTGDVSTGVLHNSGTVSATARVDGNADLDYSRAYAYGVFINDDFDGTLINTGVIEANAINSGALGDAPSADNALHAYGIYIDSDLNGTINNSGTISAVNSGLARPTSSIAFAIFVDGDSSNGTLTNSGTIIGAVQLNGGTLNLNGGSIDGPITSGNALDVNVGGVVKSSGHDLSGANVDAFTIRNKGDWRLDRNMVDVATFSVLSGGRLTFARDGVNLVEDVPNAGTVAVAAGVNGNLTGNLTQATGATFEVASSNPTNFGTLNVTGTADLTASGKVFVTTSGILANGQVDDVMVAGTLLAGTLTTTDDILFYDVTAIKDGNTIDLNVERGVFISDIIGDVPYAGGVAGVLDELLDVGGSGGDMDTVLIALSRLGNAEEVAQAVAQFTPALAGGSTEAVNQALDAISTVVGNRIGAGRGLAAGDSMYEQGHLWVKPFGAYADHDTRQGRPGFDADTIGISFGGDVQLNSRARLGAAFAWSDTEIEGKTIATNEVNAETYQLVFYGDYDLNASDFVEGYALVGWNDNDHQRNIVFGPINRTAKADYDSIFTRIYTGVGREYRTSDRWTFAPMATLRYTYIDEDGYTETGGGALSLTVNDRDADSLILGVDGVGTYTFGADSIYSLKLRAGVGYDVLTDRTIVTSTFAGGGGAFATRGVEPDEFVYRAGFGFKAQPKDLMSIHIDYQFQGREDFQSHGGSLNLRWRF